MRRSMIYESWQCLAVSFQLANNKFWEKQKNYDLLRLLIANLCQLKRSFNINKSAGPSTLRALLRSGWWRLIWINISESDRLRASFKFIYLYSFSSGHRFTIKCVAFTLKGDAPPGDALLAWMTRHYYSPSFI